jgi:hypothetical protein
MKKKKEFHLDILIFYVFFVPFSMIGWMDGFMHEKMTCKIKSECHLVTHYGRSHWNISIGPFNTCIRYYRGVIHLLASFSNCFFQGLANNGKNSWIVYFRNDIADI